MEAGRPGSSGSGLADSTQQSDSLLASRIIILNFNGKISINSIMLSN